MVRPRLGPSPRRADALLLAAKRGLRGGDSAMDVDSEPAAAADDGLTPLDTDGDGDGDDAAGFVCGVCGLADSGGLPPPAPAAESAARPWAPGYARSPAGAKAPSPLTTAAGSSSSSSGGARDGDGNGDGRGATRVLVNFRELLWYWKEYYLRRGRDRLSIEFSSHIPFALWEALVDTLCRDDGSPEALLPAPVRRDTPPLPHFTWYASCSSYPPLLCCCRCRCPRRRTSARRACTTVARPNSFTSSTRIGGETVTRFRDDASSGVGGLSSNVARFSFYEGFRVARESFGA
jgi:hypothetical protein